MTNSTSLQATFSITFVKLFTIGTFLAGASAPQGSYAAESIRIATNSQKETRVETRIEVSGELKLFVPPAAAGTAQKKTEDAEKSSLPVEVNARLVYDDHVLTPSNDTLLSHRLRRYSTAEATMKVGKGTIVSKLSSDHEAIVVHETVDQTRIFSPIDPLTREELDLLTVAGDSGLLNAFSFTEAVKLGDQRQPGSEAVSRFLRWDSVNRNDLELKLLKVDGNIAILELTGKADGGVDGTVSEAELNGKLNFAIDTGLCTWLAISIKEKRAASQGSPGFETTTRIRTATVPANSPPYDDATIAAWKIEPSSANELLVYRAEKQGFELVYEPKWRVVGDRHEVSILRYLERGELIAQCNISKLDPLPAGEQLSLTGFQADLKRSLGNSFIEFLEASEALGESGLRILRVGVSGRQDDVPIHWVFYHLSDDERNRASFGITMDADMSSRFGKAESTLVGSFHFVKKQAETPAPALDVQKIQQSFKPQPTQSK